MTAAYSCIDEILDEVLVQCPGATTKAAQLATKATLREFFVDSTSWRVDLQPFNLKPGKVTYYLDPPIANTNILYIHNMAAPFGDGHRYLTPVNREMSKLQLSTTRADLPMWYHGYADTPGKVSIYPELNDTAGEAAVIATVSLIYRDPWDKQIPQFVMRYWRDVLIDGVMGKLMSQQDKPYTNPGQASYCLRRFRSGVARARDMAQREYTEAEHTVTFPGFAGKSQNRFRP